MEAAATMGHQERQDFEDTYEEAKVGVRAIHGFWDLCLENPDERSEKGWNDALSILEVLHRYLDERVDRLRTLHHEETRQATD
jgi:hypothetical protein